jgi:fumarate reductase subunit D
MKRSHAPVLWVLFGAGGMLSALIGPVLVFIAGVAVPLGLALPSDALAYQRMLAWARPPLGKVVIFAVIVLFAWHAAHRLYKSLHDVGVKPGPWPRLFCYGAATAVTLLTVWGLFELGF